MGFTVSFFGATHHFGLGRVDLPLDRLFRILRDAINALDFLENQLGAAAAALATAFARIANLDALQREQDAKSSAHTRLEAIRRDYTATPKQITIASPAPAQVCNGSVEVIVRCGAVPPSTLRIVLTGPIASFGGMGVGYHAAPMTTPISHQPTVEGYMFRIWSTHLTENRPLAERDLFFADKASLRRKFSDFITIKYRER